MDKVSRQRSYFVNLSAEVRTQVLSEACQKDKWELYHRTYAANVRRWLRVLKKSDLGELFNTLSQRQTVRPEGADHQWRKEPPRELSFRRYILISLSESALHLNCMLGGINGTSEFG